MKINNLERTIKKETEVVNYCDNFLTINWGFALVKTEWITIYGYMFDRRR